MSIIPFIVAAILLTTAYKNKKSADFKAKNWITSRGKIIEIKTYWTIRRHHAPVITFYTAERQPINFNGKGSQRSFYAVGQFVEVVYNPLNLNNAEVKYDPSDAEMRRLRFLMGGFFLFGFLVFFAIDMMILFLGIRSVLEKV
jgi:hypothetical protein